MSTATKQVGGTHYEAEYQHWDWVVDTNQGYLAGNCSKYVVRWRKKNGVEDLQKARSYLAKLIETAGRAEEPGRDLDNWWRSIRWANQKFLDSFSGLEREFLEELTLWESLSDLNYLMGLLDQIVETAQTPAGGKAAPPGA